MTEMTPLVRSYFEAAGWYEGRDVSDGFKFPEGKFISQKALDLMKEFGYLKVAYRCVDGDGFMYFDIDDSEASKILRRDFDKQYFRYGLDDVPYPDTYNGNQYIDEWEIEDLEDTDIKIEEAGINLTRIGMFIDYGEPGNITISEKGGVWINKRTTIDNLIEYCNYIMTGEKPAHKEFKAWYSRGLNK